MNLVIYRQTILNAWVLAFFRFCFMIHEVLCFYDSHNKWRLKKVVIIQIWFIWYIGCEFLISLQILLFTGESSNRGSFPVGDPTKFGLFRYSFKYFNIEKISYCLFLCGSINKNKILDYTLEGTEYAYIQWTSTFPEGFDFSLNMDSSSSTLV